MIEVTEHAAERYVQRVRPGLAIAAALSYLRTVAATARRVPGRTRRGELRYEVDDCFLIVKQTKDAGLVAVTVYPKQRPAGSSVEDWLALLEADTERLVAEYESRPVPTAALVEPEPFPPDPVWIEPEPKFVLIPTHPPPPKQSNADRRVAAVVAHYERMVAGKEREQERIRAHATRMEVERETLRKVLRRIRHFIPDTPEARELVGEFAGLVWPSEVP